MATKKPDYYSKRNKREVYDKIKNEPKKLRDSLQKIVDLLAKKKLAMFEIAEKTGLTQSGVCGRIGELKELKLVRSTKDKHKSPHNVGCVVWELTGKKK